MRLNATMDELNYIMNALLQGRFAEHEIKTDDEFIFQAGQGTYGSPLPLPY